MYSIQVFTLFQKPTYEIDWFLFNSSGCL